MPIGPYAPPLIRAFESCLKPVGAWRGAWEAVPAAIQAYHVDRSSLDWWPRYG